MIRIILPSSKIDGLKDAINLDIIINQSKLAKRMSLKIDVKKRLPILTLPKNFSKKQAIKFVEDHKVWIENKLSAIPKQKELKFGEAISLLGVEYIITPSSTCRSNCKIDGAFLYAPTDERFLHARIIKFIKSFAKEKLFELSKQKADLIGASFCSIAIKDTKSRWGSCSIKGNINYNFRLALAPLYVCEAIVCHEVCHLLEHNHGEGFYNLLYKICPEYDKAEHWLKQSSKKLYGY